MTMEYAAFDASGYLDNEKVVADVAKARGMARVAKDSGLGRGSLYKALSPGSAFETIDSDVRSTCTPHKVGAGRRQRANKLFSH